MAYVTAREKEILKNMKHFGISRLDAEEMYEYDNNFTNSDKDAQEYLKEELMMEDALVDDMFHKEVKPKKSVSKKAHAKATAAAKDVRVDRLDYLAERLGTNPLFGEAKSITSTTVVFVAPDTGKEISLKISRHKEQKVVTKAFRRKVDKVDGRDVARPYTVAEQRAILLHEAVMARPDLFEAVSLAGAQVGFADARDVRPFGSIRLTHHR